MKITLARTAGFCFGVNRALKLAYDAAESGINAVTLGMLIHNKSVADDLRRRGIEQIADLDEYRPGQTIIIRSHGVGRSVYEKLARLGAPVIDATCPFVLRIHEIVETELKEGRTVFVIGAREHPEVEGIADGHEHVFVFENTEEIRELLSSDPGLRTSPVSVVFQTTLTQNAKVLVIDFVKKICTNIRIFDTICKSTEKRQEEAAALARTEQMMIVLGDKSSSNSCKLAETCREYCDHVIFAESACEIEAASLAAFTSVGITAGASTPPWIIKEVYDKMSDNPIADATTNISEKEAAEQILDGQFEQVQAAPAVQANDTAPQAAETIKEEVPETEGADISAEDEESFESMLERSFKTLTTGEKVSGTVTAITPTEVYVDLGTKHAGYIPLSEISDDPTAKAEDIFKIGDAVEAYTIRVNDIEGTAMLSKKRLDTQKNWDTVETAYENKGVVEGVVTEENKGGIVVSVKGIRVFVPASQTGLPKDTPMSELIKTKVRLRITEVNRARRRVIGSIRSVKQEERRIAAEKVWSEIEVGKHYSGTVKSLTSYGAFVDIGGVDGMVHVTELSWDRIKSPADVVAVGDNIDVYVISFDKEKRKISLGCKNPEDNPWVKFTNKYAVGDVVPVKIVKFMNFGAFAQIIPGVDGLIHISQIADRRIGKPQDVLSEGQELEVQITEIDNEKKRVSLSIRALLNKAREEEQIPADPDEPEKVIPVF